MRESIKVGLRADRILGMTATAVAASTGAGLVGDVSTASAAIVYSGATNIVIPDNLDGVYFNVVTGATGTAGGAVPGWDINPYTAGPANGGFNLWGWSVNTWLSPSGAIGGPYVLPEGFLVDGSGTFLRPGGGTNIGPEITLNAANYFGFRFQNEALGNAINFAWVEITFGGSFAERSITRYAYEDTGSGIQVGAVPEPSSLSVLALGAMGVLARRRNRATMSQI